MTVLERTAPPPFEAPPRRRVSRAAVRDDRLPYAGPASASGVAPDLSRRAALIALLLLTLLGGGLRFASLDKPTLWGDEASTFRRTCGTYGELLDNLRLDGFVPLHYQLYWWINQGLPLWPKAVTTGEVTTYDTALRLAPGRVTMTPVVMRLVPAVCGTLMVPAVYFFAAQLVDRRRALLAAGLAAGSAYLLVYSRDAKMYMPFWLLVTLHAGCLFGWLRTVGHAGRLYWWAWVAAGAAMVGYHALGLFVLGIELVIVLTYPSPGWRHAGGAVGRVLTAPLLPIAYVFDAIIRWTDGQTVGPWSERGPLGRRWQRSGESFRWPPVVPFLIGALLISLGPVGYYTHFNRYADKIYGDDGQRLADPDFDRQSDLSWVKEYNRGRDGGDLVLYTASAYLTGWEWPREVDQPAIPEGTRKLLKGATVLLIGLLALGLLPWRSAAWLTGRLDLRPDGLPPGADPPPRPRVALWLTAWVVVPLYVFYCMSMGGFESPASWALGTVFDEPPAMQSLPRLELPEWAGGDPTGTGGSWWGRAADVVRANWAAVFASATAQNVRWLLLAGLLAAGAAGLLLCARTWRGRLPKAGSAAAAGSVVLLLCLPVYLGLFIFRPTNGTSVWMPRYLGFMLPAVLVGVAILFGRLPTRPLRWFAVGLFAAVNLGQFAGRVWGGSEPPTDLLAADLVAAKPDDPTAKPPQQTYVRKLYDGANDDPNGGGTLNGAPGGGGLNSQVIRYFYTLAAHLTPGEDYRPADIRNYSQLEARYMPRAAGRFPYDRFVQAVARRATQKDAPRTLIVWQGLPPGRGSQDHAVVDALNALNPLGGTWKMVDQHLYPVREHWTWRDLYTARRRTFVREDAPATRPK